LAFGGGILNGAESRESKMSKIGKDVSASQGIPKSLWEECGMELLGPPLKILK
jgi:hypothetical protein